MDLSENLENEMSSVICADISAASSAPGWGSPLPVDKASPSKVVRDTPSTRGKLADLSAFLNGEVANAITSRTGRRIGIARVSPLSTVIEEANDAASAAGSIGLNRTASRSSARGTVVMGLAGTASASSHNVSRIRSFHFLQSSSIFF